MLDADQKRNVEARMRRIAGQVAGVQRMVEDERYCVDVLIQVAAVRAALSKVSKIMLASHIQTCVQGAFESDDPSEQDKKIEELIRVFDKNCRGC